MKGKTLIFTTCTSVHIKGYTKGRALMLNHAYQQSYP